MPNATRPIGLRGRPLVCTASTTGSRCRCSRPPKQTTGTLAGGTVMKSAMEAKADDLTMRGRLPLATPTDLGADAVRDLAAALNRVLADVFVLYLKTKNFHWHMSG